MLYYLLTHPFTHALTFTHSFTHSFTHALAFTHSLIHSLAHSPTHSLTHSLTYPLTGLGGYDAPSESGVDVLSGLFNQNHREHRGHSLIFALVSPSLFCIFITHTKHFFSKIGNKDDSQEHWHCLRTKSRQISRFGLSTQSRGLPCTHHSCSFFDRHRVCVCYRSQDATSIVFENKVDK